MTHVHLAFTLQKTVLIRRRKRQLKRVLHRRNYAKNLTPYLRTNVKVLKSCPLWSLRTQRSLLIRASSKSSSLQGDSERTNNKTAKQNKRLRITDVIRNRQKASMPMVVKWLTPLTTDVQLRHLWNSICASLFATGLYCGNHVASVISNETIKRPLVTCSISWPVCVSIGAGVMLIFKAQVNYARSVQVRRLWSKILGKAKDLCMTNLTTTVEKRRFGRWILVLLFSLRSQLTTDGVIHDFLCGALTPTEFFAVVESKNRVMLSLQVLTDLIAENCVEVYLAASMNAAVNNLSSCTTRFTSICEESKLDIYRKFGENTNQLWTAAFSTASVGSVGLWGIPLTAAFAYLLTSFDRRINEQKDPLQYLTLEQDCFAFRDCIDQMHLDHAQMRRIIRGGSFASGSNVIPADGLTGELGPNTANP